jgi:hypothetical protein
LNAFFKAFDGQHLQQFNAACLLEGFLRERKGDKAGSLASWQRGKLEARGGGVPLLQCMMLASLSGQMTDDRAKLYYERMLKGLPADFERAILSSGFRLPAVVMRDMWQYPRCHDAARRIALQSVSYAEYLKLPLACAGYSVLRKDAMPATLSSEQDEVVWQLANRMCDMVLDGKFTQPNAFQLALSWKGISNFLGWGGLSQSVDPSLKAPLAYVLGFRFERLNQPTVAADLFRTAARNAAAGSPLRNLAEQEAQRLDKKK